MCSLLQIPGPETLDPSLRAPDTSGPRRTNPRHRAQPTACQHVSTAATHRPRPGEPEEGPPEPVRRPPRAPPSPPADPAPPPPPRSPPAAASPPPTTRRLRPRCRRPSPPRAPSLASSLSVRLRPLLRRGSGEIRHRLEIHAKVNPDPRGGILRVPKSSLSDAMFITSYLLAFCSFLRA